MLSRVLPALICTSAVSILTASCASLATTFAGPPRYEPAYTVELAAVQRPAKAAERYGPQAIAVIPDSSRTKYAFEDALVKVVAVPARDRIMFNITNKTDNVIRLPWDEAAIVDVNGQSQQVMHTGMKYTDCASPKAPSIIAPHGALEDEAIPCANLHSFSTWTISDMIPSEPVEAKDTAQTMRSARGYVGKDIRLLLPLQIEDVTNDYVFTFHVKGAALEPWSFASYMQRQP